MGWLISMIFCAIVVLALFFVGRYMKHGADKELRSIGKLLMIISLVLLLVWGGVHTCLSSFKPIQAGHVGVVYQFGGISGQIGEGSNWIAPWRTVRTANIQVQGHNFENLQSFSIETQDVFVEATLNIQVSPGAIQNLYRTVGPNWYAVLVAPRVDQNFKDETVKYSSVDIAPHREDIRKTVRDRLEKELSPYSIEVVDLLLNNIDFNPEFKAAIEAKQIATQNALEEEQRVQVSKYQADQKIEAARGEGGAILAVAEKQSEANELLSQSLTPQLIQYSLIQKLAANIKVIILPAGQTFILDPGALLGAQLSGGQ